MRPNSGSHKGSCSWGRVKRTKKGVSKSCEKEFPCKVMTLEQKDYLKKRGGGNGKQEVKRHKGKETRRSGRRGSLGRRPLGENFWGENPGKRGGQGEITGYDRQNDKFQTARSPRERSLIERSPANAVGGGVQVRGEQKKIGTGPSKPAWGTNWAPPKKTRSPRRPGKRRIQTSDENELKKMKNQKIVGKGGAQGQR